MDSLTAYTTDWLRSHAFFSLGTPGYWRANAAWLNREERDHAGFAECLRKVALEFLDSGNADDAGRALRVLAVVGKDEDVARLKELAVRGDLELSQHARRALWQMRWRKYRQVWAPVLLVVVAVLIGVMKLLTTR
jgi:hypothetical protein